MVTWCTRTIPRLFGNVSSHRWTDVCADWPPLLRHSVGTVRAALEVKAVFEQLAQAEKGGVTPEQRKKLEEQAAEKVRRFLGGHKSPLCDPADDANQGMQALFKVCTGTELYDRGRPSRLDSHDLFSPIGCQAGD